MPEAKPAPAPQRGDIHAFGTCVDSICALAAKESLEEVGDIVLYGKAGKSSVGVAYWGDRIVGLCGVSRPKDILWEVAQVFCSLAYDVLMTKKALAFVYREVWGRFRRAMECQELAFRRTAGR